MNLYKGTEIQRGSVGCVVCGSHYVGLTVQKLMELFLLQEEERAPRDSYSQSRWLVKTHIDPDLGDREIVLLTRSEISAFLQEKQVHGRKDGSGGLAEHTIRSLYRVLDRAFQMVSWDDISDVGLIDAPDLKPMSSMLSLHQAEEFTDYLVEHLDRCGAGFLLCLYAGLKLSELCALLDSDFDLVNDRLYIRRELRPASGGSSKADADPIVLYSSEKSENRVLALPLQLSMPLWTLLRHARDDGFFLSGTKYPMNQRTCMARFKLIAGEAGLPQASDIHMLRNTFAWMWLLRRNDPQGLARVLGYANASYYSSLVFGPLMEHLNVRLPECAKYLILNDHNDQAIECCP